MRNVPSRSDDQAERFAARAVQAGPAAEGRIGGRANLPSGFPIIWWTLLASALFALGVDGLLNGLIFPASTILLFAIASFLAALNRVGAISKARGI